MKLLRGTEFKITKVKNGQNMPRLKITEVVLVHCNIVNNDYQQDSTVLHTFFPNKLFRSLFEMSPTNQASVIRMWYSNEPKNRIYVKEYGFLTFAKNMSKDLSYKYSQKILDSAKNLQRMEQKLLQKE